MLIAAVNADLSRPAWLRPVHAGVQLLTAATALKQLGIAQNIVAVGFGITSGGVVQAGHHVRGRKGSGRGISRNEILEQGRSRKLR